MVASADLRGLQLSFSCADAENLRQGKSDNDRAPDGETSYVSEDVAMADAHPTLAALIGSVFLLLAAAYGVFRVIVRREYRLHGCLTGWASTLPLLVFAGLMAFPYSFNPPEWPLSRTLAGPTSRQLQILGLVVILLGFLSALGTMGWFGVRRAFGIEAHGLISTGPYRFTRNPQILSGHLLVIGVTLQWPSWPALLWIALYGVIGHWMVIAEEEHLRVLLGDEYVRYCQRVPRYLFWRGTSRKDPGV